MRKRQAARPRRAVHRWVIGVAGLGALVFALVSEPRYLAAEDAAGSRGTGNSMTSQGRGSSQGPTSGTASQSSSGTGTRESATEQSGSTPAPSSRGTGVKGRPAPAGQPSPGSAGR